MDKLKALSTKEKEQLLQYLGKIYRKGCFQEKMILQGVVEDSGPNDDIALAALLKLLLRRMEQSYAVIIMNDFFEIQERGWWQAFFSRSTYYRYKKEAVNLLLSQLYAESD